MKKFILSILVLLTTVGLFGCLPYDETTIVSSASGDAVKIVYEAKLYDNQGNNFLNFEGQEFTITPNKVKLYAYDTDGSWTSYYETSSVVTVEIDGNFIQTCGSTIIFKDTRLEMLDIPSELSSKSTEGNDDYSVTEDKQGAETYFGLRYWWYNIEEKGQHGSKIVLIQSQDGYNIGAFVGNDVTWEVASKLPKTTKIMVDGLPVYIHRCNFTIIDAALMETDFE